MFPAVERNLEQGMHDVKVTRQSYVTWKLAMQAALEQKGLWCYVDGSVPKPEQPAEAALWEAQDKEARTVITLAIGPLELGHIHWCRTARDMWVTLEQKYTATETARNMDATLEREYALRQSARKGLLLKQLLVTKLDTSKNMARHLNILFDTVKKLAAFNTTIPNDLLSAIILYSLPKEYEDLQCASEISDTLPEPQALRTVLLEKAGVGKANHTTSVEETGGTVKKARKNTRSALKALAAEYKRRRGKPMCSRKCVYCQTSGHKTVCEKRWNYAPSCKKKPSRLVEKKRVRRRVKKTVMPVEELATELQYIDSEDSVFISQKGGIQSDLEHLVNEQVKLSSNRKTVEITFRSKNNASVGEVMQEVSSCEELDAAEEALSKDENLFTVKFKRAPGRPKIVRTGTRGPMGKQYNLVPVYSETQAVHRDEPMSAFGVVNETVGNPESGIFTTPDVIIIDEFIKDEFILP